MQELNLRKQQVIDLKKSKGLDGKRAEVVFALDFSGSMRYMFGSGIVQKVIERLFPVALAFDDDGKMPMYLFSNNSEKISDVTLNNYESYVQSVIGTGRSMGGTSYAPVLKSILSNFGSSSGFAGFGKKSADPVYLIFITDGSNDDKSASESVIREMSKKNIFVQFIGIGSDRFDFLQKLDDLGGRDIDNTDFKSVNDISNISDSDLYELLMDEFPGWMEEAKAKGLIN